MFPRKKNKTKQKKKPALHIQSKAAKPFCCILGRKKTKRNPTTFLLCCCYCFGLFVCFGLFRATLVACGDSQARDQISTKADGHSYSHTRSKSCLETTLQLTATAHILTHWVGQGIELVSLWILVEFIIAESQWELPRLSFWEKEHFQVSY